MGSLNCLHLKQVILCRRTRLRGGCCHGDFASSQSGALPRPVRLPTVRGKWLCSRLASFFLLGAGRIFWATSTKLGRVNGSQNDLKQVVLRDRSYAFLTNGDGDIEICSEAASERFDGPNRQNLAQCLMSIFANPDPLLFRLFTQSASTLSATEQVKTRKGITACR